MFTVLLPLGDMALTRKAFMDAMQREGIGTGAFLRGDPPRLVLEGEGLARGPVPVSERIGRETVTLPLFPEMTPGDVDRVCEAARRIVRSRPA